MDNDEIEICDRLDATIYNDGEFWISTAGHDAFLLSREEQIALRDFLTRNIERAQKVN